MKSYKFLNSSPEIMDEITAIVRYFPMWSLLGWYDIKQKIPPFNDWTVLDYHKYGSYGWQHRINVFDDI